MRRDLLICAALGVATLLVYGQTLAFEFVNWDDVYFLSENPHVRAGLDLETLEWAFTNGETGSWQPIAWLSHLVDREIFGFRAGGHHAINVLLHVLNGLLVFAVLRNMTGARWRSALVAALFALHPLHVESVAWVFERKDVLSTCFGLLAIGAYASWVRRGGPARYAALAALFALSLMSKPMLVTLPCLLLLLDYWPLRRPLTARRIAEKLPLLGLSAAFGAISIVLQRRGGALGDLQVLPVHVRVANALVSYVAYLRKTLWPVDLAVFYPHPYLADTGGRPPTAWKLAAALALLLGVSLLVIRARSRRHLPVGWFWYLGTLVPVIGLVQVGEQGMADRYTYVPLIGVFLIVAWGGADLVEALRPRFARVRVLAAAVAVAALTSLAVTSWFQTRHWRDSASIFRHAVEAVPRNPKMRYNVANQLSREGRIDEAVHEYRRALAAAPNDVKLNLNLGNRLRSRGELDEAALLYRKVLELEPTHSVAHNNLATVLRAQGRLEDATRHYRRAMEIRPNGLAAYNLANLLRERGELGEAIPLYREAIRLRPRDPKPHNNLATALEESGAIDQAIDHYRMALRLDPDHYRAQANLGAALHRRGELEEAMVHYRRAIAIQPGYQRAHLNLGRALEESGRLEEAVEQYREALALSPEDPVARKLLDESLGLVERAGGEATTGVP